MPTKTKKNLLGRTVTKSSGVTDSGYKYKSREVTGPGISKKTFKEYRKGSDKPFFVEKSRDTARRKMQFEKHSSNPRNTMGRRTASDYKQKVVATPSTVRRKTVTKTGQGNRLVEKTMKSRDTGVESVTKSVRIQKGMGKTKGGRAYQVTASDPNETRNYTLTNPVSQRAVFSKEVRKNKDKK